MPINEVHVKVVVRTTTVNDNVTFTKDYPDDFLKQRLDENDDNDFMDDY